MTAGPEQEVPASPVACLSAFPASTRATCARPTDTAARRREYCVDLAPVSAYAPPGAAQAFSTVWTSRQCRPMRRAAPAALTLLLAACVLVGRHGAAVRATMGRHGAAGSVATGKEAFFSPLRPVIPRHLPRFAFR